MSDLRVIEVQPQRKRGWVEVNPPQVGALMKLDGETWKIVSVSKVYDQPYQVQLARFPRH